MKVPEPLQHHAGIRTCTLRNNKITHVDIFLHSSASTDTYCFLHIVELKKLVHVNRKRRLPHSSPLNRNTFSFVSSCETEHIPNRSITLRIFKKILRYILSTKRIARQKHGIRDLSVFGSNMCTHVFSLIQMSNHNLHNILTKSTSAKFYLFPLPISEIAVTTPAKF